MKYTLIMGVFALAIVTIPAAQADDSTEHHSKVGHQSRTENEPVKAAKPAPDGKRLPGRDCKFYEGATRRHSWPQYEIGNASRPECPEPAKQ